MGAETVRDDRSSVVLHHGRSVVRRRGCPSPTTLHLHSPRATGTRGLCVTRVRTTRLVSSDRVYLDVVSGSLFFCPSDESGMRCTVFPSPVCLSTGLLVARLRTGESREVDSVECPDTGESNPLGSRGTPSWAPIKYPLDWYPSPLMGVWDLVTVRMTWVV